MCHELMMLTLQAMEENEFIEACRQVYDGVREVRRAVLSNRGEVGVCAASCQLSTLSLSSSVIACILFSLVLLSCLMVSDLAPGGE